MRGISAAGSHAFRISLYSFLLFTTWTLPLSEGQQIDRQDSELREILAHAADYCEKLNRAVLDFVCTESIQEQFYYNLRKGKFFVQQLVRTNARNRFIYDYQLLRKNKKTGEQRILLEVNGKRLQQKDAPLLTVRFFYERVIFGPIGLLSRHWQRYLRYRIIGRTRLSGMETIIIEAIPKDKNAVEHLYGKIWIKADDHSILKIEWNPQSMGNYGEAVELAKRLRADPCITLVSEYDLCKNDIRFPSKYSIKEEYILKNDNLIEVLTPKGSKRINRFTFTEITVIYEDYKFFTVETEVKIK